MSNDNPCKTTDRISLKSKIFFFSKVHVVSQSFSNNRKTKTCLSCNSILQTHQAIASFLQQFPFVFVAQRFCLQTSSAQTLLEQGTGWYKPANRTQEDVEIIKSTNTQHYNACKLYYTMPRCHFLFENFSGTLVARCFMQNSSNNSHN